MIRRGKAFTLLETIVATFIFVTVIVMSSGFWVQCARLMEKTRTRIVAVHVAEQAMERAIAAGYYKVKESEGEGTISMDVTVEGAKKAISVRYKLDVEDIDQNTRSVKVEVDLGAGNAVVYEMALSRMVL